MKRLSPSKPFAMRFAAGLILIVISEVAVRALGYGLMPARAPDLRKPLTELPLDLGSWRGKSVAAQPYLEESIGAAHTIDRFYLNSLGDQVAVFIGVWLDYEPVFPHRPELCYTNAGWEIVDRDVVSISVPGIRDFPARILTLKKHGESIAVLYWASYGSATALDDGDVRSALQRQRGVSRQRPAGVKVILQMMATDPNAAKRTLLNFAQQLVPQLDRIAN